jgi:hypothetical protein
MPWVPLIGTVLHADGTPWAGGEVGFNLVNGFVTSMEVFPSGKFIEILDANGKLRSSLRLGVPETGTAHYVICLPDEALIEVYLADGPGANLQTLISFSGSSVSQNDIQTILNAANKAVIRNVSSAYSIVSGDQVIRASGTFVVTLPPATGSGVAYSIKNVGTGVITIDGNGAETIDGQLSLTISQYKSCSVLDVDAGIWDAL